MPSSDQGPDSEFAIAVSLHQQGRGAEAAHLFNSILSVDPGHAGALLHVGVLHLQQGETDRAVGCLQKAVNANPRSASAHANLGAALQACGRLEEAIAAHRAAVAADPMMMDAQYGLAVALQAAGQHQEALAYYEAMAARHPDQPEVFYGIGTVLRGEQRYEEAVRAYRTATALDDDFAEAHYGLATSLQRLARHEEAIEPFKRALVLDPDYQEARCGLALSLLSLERGDAALAQLDQALAAAPESAELHTRRGDAFGLIEQHRSAEAAYREALRHEPDRTDALLGLASALSAQHQEAEAVAIYEKCLEHTSDAGTRASLGAALLSLNRTEEGLALLEQAAFDDPNLARAWNGIGLAREQLGDMGGARAAFVRAVELAPDRPGFYSGLFNVAKVQPDDPAIAALEALGNLPLNEGQHIARLFALAKAYEDCGESERAVQFLLEGNARKRRCVEYNEAAMLAAQQHTRVALTAPVIRAAAGRGDPSNIPIFILGMPRSGSTLVEQILASHPLVLAGGERRDFGQALRQIAGLEQNEEVLTGMTPITVSLCADTLCQLALAYLERLPLLPPDKRHITDKMPGNFRLAGFIQLALPNAKIIHTCRDPVDTCLSCFSKLFADELNYTYDLGELGRYYHAYRSLMDHWHAVLPSDTILDVQYEAVVADLETETRRMLEFCGLPWDAACLSYHETQRPVRTASVAQVRRPIYTTSVGKWLPDEAVLRPLLDGIAGKSRLSQHLS